MVNPAQGTTQGLKIAKDSILHCTSGLMSEDNKMVLSHLHKAIKPLNQLRVLEDATVIYRISRPFVIWLKQKAFRKQLVLMK